MSSPEEQLEEIRKELQWINVKDTFSDENKPQVHVLYRLLVPAGVIATSGILGSGLYYMIKRNAQKQQLFMRYRVLAQGITIAIAVAGVVQLRFSS